MGYTERDAVAPLDLLGSVDQGLSVENDKFFYAEKRYVGLLVYSPADSLATGDGKIYFHIPADLSGMNLVSCHAFHITAGAAGNPTLVQVANVTDAVDMLSTRIMVDVGETNSKDATTAYVIDATKDDVATNDIIRIDVDQLPTTAPKGLVVTLGFAHA